MKCSCCKVCGWGTKQNKTDADFTDDERHAISLLPMFLCIKMFVKLTHTEIKMLSGGC